MMIGNKEPNEKFNAFVRQCSDKAYNFAFRLVGNEHDARDLVQEAFAKALKHFEEYDENRPFEPWLNRILKNIFLDQVRRYEYKNTVTFDASNSSDEEGTKWETILPGPDLPPDQELENREAGEMVQRALNSIPLQYRVAIILCDIERHSYQKISEILGCPIGTVRSRIHQGRQLMKKAYESLQFGEKISNF